MKKIALLLSVMSFLAVICGCSNSSSDDDLLDVIKAGEDLSGTWTLTDAYLLLEEYEDGIPDEGNVEIDNYDDFIKYVKQDSDYEDYGDYPYTVTFATAEQAAKELKYVAEKWEENAKENKAKYEQMQAMTGCAAMFGLVISEQKFDETVWERINKDRTEITFYDYIDCVIKGSMMGQSFSDTAKAKVRLVYTRS